MPVVNAERLVELQRKSADIRNICILAHVDHGKTSLTDALIATNGIISPRMAGKIRYLDSRPDEQVRGITMESSAISLSFSMARRRTPESEPEQKDYLINLIDSPGHVDFSSEVSTASRLCDGALVLVDAVEGVQSQTVTVLRQAWLEKLRPLLVINKMDRLVWELKMSATEAYTHLSRLVEEVNAVLGSFFQGERMEEDLQWRERMDERVAAAAQRDAGRARKSSSDQIDAVSDTGLAIGDDGTEQEAGEFEERDDEDLYFAPERNNIIFCSAVDGWAFTITQFAAIYEKKLGIRRHILEQVLWGDFYLDPKTKRVLSSKHLKGRALKPMFVQLVLDNIWAVYEATTGGGKDKSDPAMLEKITKSLSLKIPPHVLRSKEPRNLLTAVFQQWLPVSTAILVSVIEYLPSPPAAQAERIPAIVASSPGSTHVAPDIASAMIEFNTSSDAPCIAYVSKMVAVPAKELPQNRRPQGQQLSADEARDLARRKRAEIAKARAAAEAREQAEQSGGNIAATAGALNGLSVADDEAEGEKEPEEPDQLIGFARLYSGTLKVGDSIYVLSPKYSPAQPQGPPAPVQVTITALYLLMGRSLEPLQAVPAGCVFGVGGLAGHILKNGTLCSTASGGVNLAGVSMGGEPIVRVALEPTDPRDLSKMIEGMKLLEQSDPCARYQVLSSGEHVMATAGELHLERCLNDLRERFARCDIQASEPIVPYRESIVSAPDMAPPKNKDLQRGQVMTVSASKQLTLRVRVRPLPQELTECVEKYTATIRRLVAEQKKAEAGGLSRVDDHPDEVSAGSTLAGANEDSSTILPSAQDLDDDHPVAGATGTVSRSELHEALLAATKEIEDHPETWRHAVDRVTAFGPRRVGPNLLVDDTPDSICRNFWDESSASAKRAEAGSSSSRDISPTDLADRIAYAFQLATAQGPLCQEPLHGVAVFLEHVQISSGTAAADTSIDGSATPASNTPDDQCESTTAPTQGTDTGRLTGETIRTVRAAIRAGFLDWSPRLLLAMYSCEIQAGTEVLGRVYGVVTRRRGKILAEALHEGTSFFTIVALLPVAESFGFATEIRNRTSGNASPQLRFAGFVPLDQDPFWVPSTEDELEDLGELADRENVAKRYVDQVRRRKGLLVKELRRVEGEKARTLKK